MIIVLCSACGSVETPESASVHADPAADLTPITVVLDHYPMADTTFLYMAKEQGFFAEEGELLENGKAPNLCRTQQLIRFTDKQATKYFLQNPIGNHHIIIQGHWKNLIAELLK